jgi:AraC-like DNA-binding protein
MRELNLHSTFRQQLLFAARDLTLNMPVSKDRVSIQQLATLTRLIVRHQENICSLRVAHPFVVTVLTGTKILYVDEQAMTFEAGDLFVLPPHFTFDIINQPAPSGEYIALVLELSANLLNRVRQAYPEIVNSLANDFSTKNSSTIDLRVSLSSLLADALIHLFRGAVRNTDPDSMLNEHHLMEIVLLLLQSNIRMLLYQAICPDFLTHIRYLIRSDLASEWSLERLAKALDISISTLKRRLKNADLSYRQLLDEERMSKAMELLTQNQQSVAQIALACGYESQSRFAARFRKYHSLNPSDVRSYCVD